MHNNEVCSKTDWRSPLQAAMETAAANITEDIVKRVYEGHIDAKSMSNEEAQKVIYEMVMERLK